MIILVYGGQFLFLCLSNIVPALSLAAVENTVHVYMAYLEYFAKIFIEKKKKNVSSSFNCLIRAFILKPKSSKFCDRNV